MKKSKKIKLLLLLKLKLYMKANSYLLPRDTVTDYLALRDMVKEWGVDKNGN